jgi:hypothetical protein
MPYQVLLPPTPMGDAGRADALMAVDSLTPDGATNIWDVRPLPAACTSAATATVIDTAADTRQLG